MTTFQAFRLICEQDKSIEDLALEVDNTFSRGQLVEIDDNSREYTDVEDAVMDQLAEWM
jgi:hypothetical protein